MDINKVVFVLDKRAHVECNKGFAVLDEGRVLKTKEDILDCSANFFMLLLSIISAKKKLLLPSRLRKTHQAS